ncbi:PREDICTED: probable disease resistance protein At5g66900 [Fragaria vesca subsp. vesca]|uniref:probable disease resistance protein At5g66900 n=1 Tax=Fragaria vesca subsp. vesca TaxID=101020 RepID=UPI0002C33B04|nr:PREDICTED: probable disease resistance protein At5g66900 [Fragaria vesca subsp. vesca]
MELAITAVTTIVGAALGAAFQQLFDSVIKAHKKATKFKSIFNELNLTLESYQAFVKYIEQDINVQPMHGLDAFKVKMEEGIQLVEKCSNIHPLRLKMSSFKSRNVGKLRALNISLQTLFRILKMHVEINLTGKVSKLETSVNRIDQNVLAQRQTGNEIRGWCAVLNPPSFTVGLDEPLNDLKMKLLYNDQLSMLVLTAPGGCGKTTLAQKFCQDKQVQEKFKKNIYFVTVSEKPNVERIVEEMCQSTGSQVPEFQNEANALGWLQEFLVKAGQNPLLLVLDDVWLGSSESLLDKCHEFKRPNYKILVTSRFHFKRFRSSYELKPLNEKDAMSLFRDTTSLQDSEYDIPTELVTKTVQLCKGFPLAITVIGKDLCNQPAEIWERRVAELSKGSSILDCEKLLLDRLQSSLDALGKGATLVKECFIDLGSFPEDRRIPVAALIDMWAELHDLHLDSSSIAYLYDLSTRSLANLIVIRNAKEDTNGYYSQHFVTQHDILRSLAIHQTGHDTIGHSKRLIIDICKDVIPNWWTEHKRPTKTRLLSISTDGMFSSKWHNMHLPKAKVLVLNFQTKNYAFPKFKKTMSKSLKVLIVTNYGVTPAEVSNFTSLGSLSELKRIRLERILVPPIIKNYIQLNSLQKLSLFMCSIGRAFSNDSLNFFEAFPGLEEINIDYCSDLMKLPADLCLLNHLRKLSITNSHKLSDLPKEIGKLENLELLRLRSCAELSEFPGSVRKLKKLKVLDISNCYSIKELPEHIGELCSLEKLNMRQCSRLQELPESILDLESLTDVICDEETERLWEPYLLSLRNNIKIRVVKEEISLDWLHQ